MMKVNKNIQRIIFITLILFFGSSSLQCMNDNNSKEKLEQKPWAIWHPINQALFNRKILLKQESTTIFGKPDSTQNQKRYYLCCEIDGKLLESRQINGKDYEQEYLRYGRRYYVIEGDELITKYEKVEGDTLLKGEDDEYEFGWCLDDGWYYENKKHQFAVFFFFEDICRAIPKEKWESWHQIPRIIREGRSHRNVPYVINFLNEFKINEETIIEILKENE